MSFFQKLISLLPRNIDRSRFGSVSLCAVLLAGCSAPPTLKEQHWNAIHSTQKIEIFYNKEEHAVHYGSSQGTGQGIWTVGALLGPVGMLAAAASHYSVVKSGVDATQERSQAFNAAVKDLASTKDIAEEFALQLGEELRKAGKSVKLTQVPRLPGKLPGESPLAVAAADTTCAGGVCGTPGMLGSPGAPAPRAQGVAVVKPTAGRGYAQTPGFTPLLLRLTTSYVAPDVYSDYRPVAIVEFALVNPATAQYMLHQTVVGEVPNAKKYATWDGLKAEIPAARSQLRQALLTQVVPVKNAIFVR